MTPVVIPDKTRNQFPELVALIEASESMNDEERQYWVNILPIMTPEQIENLNGILVNEKEQLQAIDEKYAAQTKQLGGEEQIRKTGAERRKRRLARDEKEHEAGRAEDLAMAEVLEKIDGL